METVTNHPDIGADLTLYDQREAVMTAVVMSLPSLLAKLDDYQAATIIAGLLKAHMNRHAPDSDSVDDLDTIVRKAREEAENENEDY
jgi:hypothetical protein